MSAKSVALELRMNDSFGILKDIYGNNTRGISCGVGSEGRIPGSITSGKSGARMNPPCSLQASPLQSVSASVGTTASSSSTAVRKKHGGLEEV